ncbi:PQ loop protein [Schizosaccharomyces pombe]|uniref:Uncharacterized protein C2E12.03c n=1 Tax=Schizosaccharomyces pombe (strain 972 / ATCC 24843) TaxID=284812 RepID=YD03_SCHPO|nr:PQ loop protein [Schizosaccharomyces pombe]Q10227.1 RecName: Full=Uncharacterized protein C2E12.03c [Schizosaccharomyces pombe 972h-]CAA93547.1 PQ loop protein [Schizosaccharomyces pombe]|eukprot:NP_594847.1 PQ loop protein [Schizosaccharomyces pombe]
MPSSTTTAPPGTHPNATASTVFAILGTVCWCVQLIPQIIKNYRAKSTEGLDTLFILSWVVASIPLSVYNQVQELNIALKVQPELFQALAFTTFFQCLYYGSKWPLRKALFVVISFMLFSGGLQAMLILTIKLGIRRHVEWPVVFMGVLATVLVNIGFLPQYISIFRARAVTGISYLFLAIDSSGSLFSFLSLPFDRWDVLAAVDYGLLFIIEMGVFVLAFIFNVLLKNKSTPTDEDVTFTEEDGDEKDEEYSDIFSIKGKFNTRPNAWQNAYDSDTKSAIQIP